MMRQLMRKYEQIFVELRYMMYAMVFGMTCLALVGSFLNVRIFDKFDGVIVASFALISFLFFVIINLSISYLDSNPKQNVVDSRG